VLAIVGVLALAVVIGIDAAGGERQLQREGERFQALVTHACERAELGGRSVGVRVDANGFAFAMLGFDGWMATSAMANCARAAGCRASPPNCAATAACSVSMPRMTRPVRRSCAFRAAS